MPNMFQIITGIYMPRLEEFLKKCWHYSFENWFDMSVHNQWEKARKGVQLFFSIVIFICDTVGHHKLGSIHGGPNATYLCWICNCPSTLLDQPCSSKTLEEKQKLNQKGKRIFPNTLTLTDAKRNKLDHVGNPRKVAEILYSHSLNIFFMTLVCDPLGINISLTLEPLHAIFLGHHGNRLLHACIC